MTLLTKTSAPICEIKSLDDESGEFVGYGSTFGGEPDSYGDIIAPGAYKASLAVHKSKGTMPRMFWQHDQAQPIGKWMEASEDEKGLLLKGRLNMGVQRGREAHALLKAGDIDGLSIGYRVQEYTRDEEADTWTLEKLDLFEVSVVSMPANDSATVASVKAQRKAFEIVEKLKAGDRLTEREFETMAKGLGLSNSEAERAARVHLKGQGEPADADDGAAFMRALLAV